MSHKRKRVAALIEPFLGMQLDPHYLGYFECFNQGRFFEAHEVLEDLWLVDRQGPDGAFYKGLIQLAGAFVHLEKKRPSPAAALLRLALGNFENYPEIHHRLHLRKLAGKIREWMGTLGEARSNGTQLLSADTPRLELET
jgi:predicted metal-dependent hydrolase